ncbi:MAG: sugar kinase [Clostridia bacterium]|nr:sugar kinase [Clostridia bacterium]
MHTIVTLGEIMLRLQPENHLRFLQADRFEATFGGAEANVAVSLAHFGEHAVYVTKLPDQEIGQMAVNALRKYGVDVREIVRGDSRVGIYYCEKGASQRPSKVLYDRAHSAFADSDPSDYDWDRILDGASWLHVTGITPALSDACAEITLQACKKAKEKGLTVSTDLNYRKKLWTREQAGRVMREVCKYVDVCIANEEDAKDVFGIEATNTDIESGKLNRDGYIEVARKLTDSFGFSAVAVTLRESLSASDNRWSGLLYTGSRAYFSKTYDIHIVDRVGGGDSFGAGLIYALSNGEEPQTAIEFAVAASCLKHSVEGDFNMVSLQEVRQLAAGNASGRVQR